MSLLVVSQEIDDMGSGRLHFIILYAVSVLWPGDVFVFLSVHSVQVSPCPPVWSILADALPRGTLCFLPTLFHDEKFAVS
jgi:hypothetical protein